MYFVIKFHNLLLYYINLYKYIFKLSQLRLKTESEMQVAPRIFNVKWWKCWKLPKVAINCHKLPKFAKICQKLPKVATSCQKLWIVCGNVFFHICWLADWLAGWLVWYKDPNVRLCFIEWPNRVAFSHVLLSLNRGHIGKYRRNN